MPDIENQFVFDKAQKLQISIKKNQIGFSYLNWSDSDLENIRVSIRNFYRHEQIARCAYCKQKVSLKSPLDSHVEHIAPKSLHPSFMFEPKNLCVICSDCNLIKRNQETIKEIPDTIITKNKPRKQYPKSSESFKIVHPHLDNYDEHIVIFSEIIYANKTDKGHFTIGACDLNRWLKVFGWEKPTYSNAELSNNMSKFLKNKDTLVKLKALDKIKEILIMM
jgi:uncharacterized protein (TIGR02646 family)